MKLVDLLNVFDDETFIYIKAETTVKRSYGDVVQETVGYRLLYSGTVYGAKKCDAERNFRKPKISEYEVTSAVCKDDVLIVNVKD